MSEQDIKDLVKDVVTRFVHPERVSAVIAWRKCERVFVEPGNYTARVLRSTRRAFKLQWRREILGLKS